MDMQTAKQQLLLLQEKMSAYSHAMGSIYYDGVTTAPSKTASNRAHTLGILSEEAYKLSTGETTVSLLEYLDTNRELLSTEEQRMVFLLLKDIRRMQKIPMDEYVAYERLLVEADDVWHRAKETSDFNLFEPLLTRIFDTVRKFAGYCAPDMHPYDYWLNEYETGLNMQICDDFFRKLRTRLVPLIEKIKKAEQVSNECLKGFFSEAAQAKLSEYLMKTILLDTGHCGLATTEHPFTTSLGSHLDERITTNYRTEDFSSSMFSVIHEGGHALYDTGSDDRFAYTVLDGGVSMGVHESQSRFYENLLGRSKAFTSFLFPKLTEIFPSLTNYTKKDFYRAVNRVEPSLIRTEADEVTYCLHIMVRYELEKAILSGKRSVSELPAEWNRLYKEYLGIEVPDDKHGVLQDSHWSGGMIGYFPSYALGSAYGAQLLSQMRISVDVDGNLSKGDFTEINAWNKEHIWKFGSLVPPGKLLEDAFTGPFDPEYYIEYLEKKYSEIYRL